MFLSKHEAKINASSSENVTPYENLEKRKYPGKSIPFIILILGIVISIIAVIENKKQENAIIQEQFVTTANSYFKVVERNINSFFAELQSIQTFFAVSGNVTREQFLEFTAPIMSRQQSFQAVGWDPVIKYQDLKKYEEQARKEGIKDFYFFEKNEKGEKIPVKKRDVYIPVYYVEPRQQNLSVLGFDNSYNPIRMETINKAAVTGQPVASERLTLVQDTEKVYGTIIFLPVYDVVTQEDSSGVKKELKAIIFGTLRIGDLLKSTLLTVRQAPINVYFFDQSAKAEDQSLLFYYDYQAPATPVTAAPYTTLSTLRKTNTPLIEHSFTVGDRNWVFVAQAIPALMATSYNPPLILTVGLLFSLLLAVIAKYIIEHARQASMIKILTHSTRQHSKELESSHQKLVKSLEDLKQIQAQLIQAEKMSALGSLTAGIAHEINNPVNFIATSLNPLDRNITSMLNIVSKLMAINQKTDLGERIKEVEKLKSEFDLDFMIEETKASLGAIREGIKRTITIIKDLGTFARLDEKSPKRVNIHDGINSTLNILGNLFRNRIKIVKEFGEIPQIECYSGKINQVFMNLLTNAVAAIKNLGVIHIRTYMKEDNIVISIQDDGVGISKENLPKIFEPFFTTQKAGKGTGLGLSISYGIIMEHHGTIEVKSEVNKGTEFIITLPITQHQK